MSRSQNSAFSKQISAYKKRQAEKKTTSPSSSSRGGSSSRNNTPQNTTPTNVVKTSYGNVTVTPVQYSIGETPVTQTQLMQVRQFQNRQNNYARGQQFAQARAKGQAVSLGEASFVEGGSGTVTDTGTRVGGYSSPQSSFAGEGKDYVGYVTTRKKETSLGGASYIDGKIGLEYDVPGPGPQNKLREATFRERASERARKTFYPDEPQIVRDGYLIKEPRASTPVNPQGGILRDRPQLAQSIREGQTNFQPSGFGRMAVKRTTRTNQATYNLTTGTYDYVTQPKRYAERAVRGLFSSVVKSPERAIMATGATYLGGQVVNSVLGYVVTRAALATEARFGLQAGMRAAQATNYALAGVGLGTTGIYLATATPEEVGASAPQFIAFGAGYGRGFKKGSKPPLQEKGTVLEYLGIKQSLPDPAPKGFSSRTGENIALSSQNTRSTVFEVFGEMRSAPVNEQTFFSGKSIVQGETYFGKLYSQRTGTIPSGKGTYKTSSSVRGYGQLDLSRGVSTFTVPSTKTTGVGVVTSRQPRTDGYELVTSTFGVRTPKGLTATQYKNMLSPDIDSTAPMGYSTRIQQNKKNIWETYFEGVVQEKQYTSTGTQSQTLPASSYEFNALVDVAGFSPVQGIPRSAVSTPKPTKIYFDPTGGVMSSLMMQQAPKAQRTNIRTIQTGQKGIPQMPAGFGVRKFDRSLQTPFTSAIIAPQTQTAQSNVQTQSNGLLLMQQLDFAQGRASNTRNNQINRLNLNQKPQTQLRQRIAQTPILSTLSLTGTGISLIGTTPPPPPPTRLPPALPFGIPLFGLQGGTQGKGKKKREFEYAPSLTSALLGIEGEESTTQTGLELRKIRRKKRK